MSSNGLVLIGICIGQFMILGAIALCKAADDPWEDEA